MYDMLTSPTFSFNCQSPQSVILLRPIRNISTQFEDNVIISLSFMMHSALNFMRSCDLDL